jgi:PAS domain S-box-containing protein/putative nucleotidyltransferase with HDIG domain
MKTEHKSQELLSLQKENLHLQQSIAVLRDELENMEIARQEAPEVPFLLVSGTFSEATALAALRHGAVDYVFKHQLEKLGSAVIRSIEEARDRKNLADSEQRYRRLFESAKDGILILDAVSGRITQANPYICQLLGHQAQELISKKLWEIGFLLDKDRSMLLFAELQDKGYVRYENLPLRSADGSMKEVEFVSNAYLVGEQRVIQCNIRDISDRRAAERLAQLYQQETLQSLQDMVAALVALSEARDPYTAGHQARVAELATAIATEMGLDEHQIEGIRIGGLVHDIGKFAIPAEILVKPTALKKEEMALIRTHVQEGADVLRQIHFPWPVAEAVLQHHERLDGSGYPQGLQGEAIGLEGRILGVADTVEAMATHRPYRFSKGLEAALDVIESGKGKIYDSAVVDACLRLFRQKGYQLPNQEKRQEHFSAPSAIPAAPL